MRFLTLLKKELREASPWIVLAVLSLLSLSWLMIRMKAMDQGRWYYNIPSSGNIIEQHMIFRADIMLESAILMFFLSIALGLILGIRHFWIPEFTRTWQFLIHRSVTRSAVVSAKLTAAAIFMASLATAWLCLAGYTQKSGNVTIPPEPGIISLGIFYAYLGFIVYLGTTLCALTQARWYTTRMFGLVFVLMMFIAILPLTNFPHALGITVVVFVVLLVQIYHTFLKREF